MIKKLNLLVAIFFPPKADPPSRVAEISVVNMKRIRTIPILFFNFLLLTSTGLYADWLSGYSYRRQITINNSLSYGLADYQVWIPTTAFGSNWAVIKSSAQADMDDFRFTPTTATTTIPYWIEPDTNTPKGFWVRVSTLTAGDNTIYMYYGNASATIASSGTATFLVFDNFNDASINTTLWDATPTGGATITETTNLTLNQVGTGAGYNANVSGQTNFKGISYKIKAVSFSGVLGDIRIAFSPTIGGGPPDFRDMSSLNFNDVISFIWQSDGTTVKVYVNDVYNKDITGLTGSTYYPAFATFWSDSVNVLTVDNFHTIGTATATPTVSVGGEQIKWTDQWHDKGNNTFNYRKSVTISNSGSALTDYQVLVTTPIYDETDLAGSWHFNDGAGDSSGKGNNGTWSGTEQYADGKFGKCASFNGSSNISLSNTNIITGLTAFSVDFWVKPNDFTVGPYILNFFGADHSLRLGFGGSGTLSTRVDTSGGSSYMDTDAIFSTGIWYHITFIKDGSFMGVYVDGNLVKSINNAAGGGVNSSSAFKIGSRATDEQYFNGLIDELKISSQALSTTEIQNRHEAKARLDYTDIRFVVQDGVNYCQIPHWMESDGRFWSCVPNVPAGASTIYAYYGNPASSTTASNGNATFNFYDGAETGVLTDNWTLNAAGTGGSYSTDRAYAGSKSIKGILGTDFSYAHTVYTTPTPASVAFWMYDTMGNQRSYIYFIAEGVSYITGIITVNYPNNYVVYEAGTYYGSPPARTLGWHKFEIRLDGTNVKFYIDDVLIFTKASTSKITEIRLEGHPTNAVDAYFDDVFVRKYAATEPTVSVESEQESDQNPNTPSQLGQRRSDDDSPITYGSWTSNLTPKATFYLSDPNVSDTVKYQIQVSTASNFGDTVINYTSALISQGATFYTLTGLTSGTSYYWRVKCIDNSAAESGWTTANSGAIAVKIDTHTPTNVSVSSCSAGSYSQITVYFTANDTGSGLAGSPYYVEMSTASNFGGDIINSGWISQTNYPFPNLARNKKYYFRVKAKDNAGNVSDPSSVVNWRTKPGTYQEKTTTRTGPNSFGFQGDSIWEWEVAAKSGQLVTITAYIRYNTSYGAASKPKLTLYNLGITNNSQMTAGADTWEQLTVSGTPNRNGVLKLKIEGFSTTPGAKMFVDDIQINQ